jgi:NIPSNAP protein
MSSNKSLAIFFILSIFAFGFLLGRIDSMPLHASADTMNKGQVFEIRTYTTEEGRLEALLARFRNHTTRLFEKHGMTNIGYWVPEDPPLSQNTLIYILAHPSRDAANKHWEEFRNDVEWKRVREQSEMTGKIVKKVESVFMKATDYSPLK